jgi:hypothetical protein
MKLKNFKFDIIYVISIFLSTISANILWKSLGDSINPVIGYIIYIVSFVLLLILVQRLKKFVKKYVDEQAKLVKKNTYYDIISQLLDADLPISTYVNGQDIKGITTFSLGFLKSIEFRINEKDLPKPIEVEDAELE